MALFCPVALPPHQFARSAFSARPRSGELAGLVHGWRELAADPPVGLDVWAAAVRRSRWPRSGIDAKLSG